MSKSEAKTHLVSLQEHSNEIINQFGDGVPYSLPHYKDKLRGHMARSAEEALNAGRCLIVIKEHEHHGNWLDTLNDLGLNHRLAQRMMQAAFKFSNASLRSHLVEAAKSKTKLFELMVLDDEELDALGDGATVSGITLDDVDRMTVSDLRKALREARAQDKAKDQVLSDKNQRIDQLSTDLERTQNKLQLNPTPPEEEAAEIRKQAAKIGFEAEHHLRVNVREAFQAVLEQGEAHGIDTGIWVRGQLDQIADSFNYLCEQLGIVSWLEEHPPYDRGEAEVDEIPIWSGENVADMEVES